MTVANVRADRLGHPARLALWIGAAGLIASVAGMVLDPAQAFASYLAAYADVWSVALGALILVMISHVTAARWFAPLRGLALGAAAVLPVLAALFLPILAGLRILYPWVPPVAPGLRETVAGKAAYLNVPFFVARAIVYFAMWTTLAWQLRRWSRARREEARPDLAVRERKLSAGGLVAIAITLTFAAFDWLMSLSPEWFSTIFGVYIFAGGFVAALGLAAVLARLAQGAGLLSDPDAAAHYQALGNLMLTFVIFWAYIAFSQYLIIWIGDIPKEVAWYTSRARGSWGALGLVLVAGHFAIPFLALLPREVKRNGTRLAIVGAWLLLMHYLDLYWIVLPHLHPLGVRPHVLDLTALAAVWGLGAAYALQRFRW